MSRKAKWATKFHLMSSCFLFVCVSWPSQWLAWSFSFARQLWSNGTGIVSTPCFTSLYLPHEGFTGRNFIFQWPAGQQHLFSPQMVSHPSTNLGPLCLTSVIWRELVFSKRHWPLSMSSCWRTVCVRGDKKVNNRNKEQQQVVTTSI